MGRDDLIRGGADMDFLDGRKGNDIVLVGDGNDYIDGYLGRDILVGGAGSDRANGGSGEDLLISVVTNFDHMDEAVLSLASIWNGEGIASERRTVIEQNSVYQSRSLTVLYENSIDSLLGGTEIDLFSAGQYALGNMWHNSN